MGETVVRFDRSMLLLSLRRAGQLLLLPFLLVGLLVGLVVLVTVLAWRTGKVGYRLVLDLADRRQT